jgi:hypothetical protein
MSICTTGDLVGSGVTVGGQATFGCILRIAHHDAIPVHGFDPET